VRRFCVKKIGASALFFCMWGLSSVLAFGNMQDTPINKKYLKSGIVFDFTIMGSPVATKDQCVKYLLKRNPLPLITTTPKQLVEYYYLEAGLEGIRPDLAFAQALHETGNFRYGGDVIPLQNNYCVLGTTGNGVKGAWFESAEIGVRAQIQHLLAYTTKRPPVMSIVDPRYNLVKSTDKFGKSFTWTDLNGKWAVPGKTYGQMILIIHEKILAEK
jgi:hypothetical protein